MSAVSGLRCRECGRTYPQEPIHVCDYCFGPLELEYDYDAIRKQTSRAAIAAGPRSIFRYRDFLPIDGERVVDLGTGFTPLIHAENLGKALGLNRLYLKNDCVNPTYSFKDRPVAVAATKALEFGFDTLACASTGNLAGSVAAHAAKAGMRAFVFIPDDLEQGKVIGAGVYGPNLVTVRGNYDDVNRLCSEVADKFGWAFVNINVRPYYTEGSKTLGFEVAEQLGWQAPDHIVAPIGSGGLLLKVHKGLHELATVGLIDEPRTRMHAAQPAGCSTVVRTWKQFHAQQGALAASGNGAIIRSFKEGGTAIEPVKPHTIAKSLAMGNPADGYYALQLLQESGGDAEDASDEEIIAAMQLLAQTEGIFAETAGGTTVASLQKLAARGVFGPDDVVVALITGNGLKTQEALYGKLAPTIPVTASLRAFEAALAAQTPRGAPAGERAARQENDAWPASASSSPTQPSLSPSR